MITPLRWHDPSIADAISPNRNRAFAEKIVRTRYPGYDAFFLVYSALLFSLVVVGFAPTFFLRFLFDNPVPLTIYLFVHGAILTGWYLLLIVQASLIRQDSRSLHRKVGYASAGYAVIVIVGALTAPLARVQRVQEMGATLEMDIAHTMALDSGISLEQVRDEVSPIGLTTIEVMSGQMWGLALSLFGFATLIGAAICYRNRSDIHKRLVLLSSLPIIGPALSRVSGLPFLGGEGGPFSDIALVVLLAALVLYDIATRRKPHPATLIGSAVVVASWSFPVNDTEFWQPVFRFFA